MKEKVLVLSDLFWESHLKGLTEKEVNTFTLKKLGKSRYHCIKKYASIVVHEKPSIVLFAGDITGDGSCGHGYERAFIMLLMVLESQGIPSITIPGNHDPEEHYAEVRKRISLLKYAQEGSDKRIEIKGKRILGIPYATTKRKKKLKKLINQYKGQVDIVLAHSPLKRRTWLFDFNAPLVVTGHFDQKLTSIFETVFISLNNNWEDNVSYASVVMSARNKVKWAEYCYMIDRHITRIKEKRSNLLENKVNPIYHIDDHPIQIQDETIPISPAHKLSLADFRGVFFKHGVQTLIKKKNEGVRLSSSEKKQLTSLYVHSDFKFSSTMIKDYMNS